MISQNKQNPCVATQGSQKWITCAIRWQFSLCLGRSPWSFEWVTTHCTNRWVMSPTFFWEKHKQACCYVWVHETQHLSPQDLIFYFLSKLHIFKSSSQPFNLVTDKQFFLIHSSKTCVYSSSGVGGLVVWPLLLQSACLSVFSARN